MSALSDGSPPREIRCAGGAARSGLWLQIKADVLGVATAATQCPEPTSLGAAVLAEAALDGADVQTVARRWACLRPPHRPDPKRHRQYHLLRSGCPNSISRGRSVLPMAMQEKTGGSLHPEQGISIVYLYMIVLVAAVGGFLFGYEIQLISGAIIFLKAEFALIPLWKAR